MAKTKFKDLYPEGVHYAVFGVTKRQISAIGLWLRIGNFIFKLAKIEGVEVSITFPKGQKISSK